MSHHSHKPDIIVGAEQLTGTVYKTGDEFVGFKYRFNIVRLNKQSGRVSHWFSPSDIFALVKVIRVLSAELVNDGCLEPAVCCQLAHLSSELDELLREPLVELTFQGASK